MADIVMKIDDLNGTPIGEGEGGAVVFSFRGQDYSIDLTNENEEKLAELLAPFIAKAKKLDAQESAGIEVLAAPSQETIEVAKGLVLEELDEERAKVLRAEAASNLAAGNKPYSTIEARQWLTEQGIEFNKMGPLSKQYRDLFELHYGLPPYDVAPQHKA